MHLSKVPHETEHNQSNGRYLAGGARRERLLSSERTGAAQATAGAQGHAGFFQNPPSVCWPTARIDSCASHHLLCAMKGSVVAAAAVPQTVIILRSILGHRCRILVAFSIKLPRSLYLISAMHATPNH